MIPLFPKQNVGNVGKLIIFGNLLDSEIMCLVFPTTFMHLIFVLPKGSLVFWIQSRDMVPI